MQADLTLQQLDALPEGLLDANSTELEAILKHPTLIHLPGRREQPLLVSVLMHGNETTGWLAVQEVLNKYQDQQLPRAMSLFISNISAAHQGLRRLDSQTDYNRAWPGTEAESCAETGLMQEVFDVMQAKTPFASIDIHNNTGLNPYYACVNVLRSPHLQLASLFSRTVVYFVQPRGTQAAAMAEVCPAITMECGKPAEPAGVAHVAEFVDACLHLSQIPDHPPAAHDVNLYHTVARVRVPENVKFSFDDDGSEIRFLEDLERLNFQKAPEGVVLAHCDSSSDACLEVLGESGEDRGSEFFECSNGHLKLRKSAVFSMLTLDTKVIRQDCLCYLMEELEFETLLKQGRFTSA